MELPVCAPEERGLSPSFATPEGGIRTLETVGRGGLGGASGTGCADADGDSGDRTGLLELLLELPRLDAVGSKAEAGYFVLGISGGGRLNAGSPVAAGRREAKLGPPSMVLLLSSFQGDRIAVRAVHCSGGLLMDPSRVRSSSRTAELDPVLVCYKKLGVNDEGAMRRCRGMLGHMVKGEEVQEYWL